MTNKAKSPRRLKQDGSTDTMCLSCFETFTPSLVGAILPHTSAEVDHICAFAFPERRSNDVTFEYGPKRRQSDMDWQALVGREATLAAK